MPHKCVHCSKIVNPGSRELLDGCSGCGGKFFFYIRDEWKEKEREKADDIEKEIERIENLNPSEKEKVEADVREILDVTDVEEPVILDVESVRISSPGKFEIDLTALFNKKPIIFKLREGKYIIDLKHSMPVKEKEE